MRIRIALAAAITCAASLAAQSPPAPLTFEVASIRLNTSGRQGGGGRPRAGGGFDYTNIPVRSLIGIAFGIPTSRILGGPAWIVSDRYDINATGKANPTNAETAQMTLALLRDRFKLQARVEPREIPVYFLAVARADGRFGPGLRRAAIDCNDTEARKKAYAAATPGSRIVCGFTVGGGVVTAGGSPVSILLGELTAASGRPVLDRTELTGGYDIDLTWTPTPQPDADAVSIFTAVQEQLGLKLESGTAPLDVVVIERIERPTEN